MESHHTIQYKDILSCLNELLEHVIVIQNKTSFDDKEKYIKDNNIRSHFYKIKETIIDKIIELKINERKESIMSLLNQLNNSIMYICKNNIKATNINSEIAQCISNLEKLSNTIKIMCEEGEDKDSLLKTKSQESIHNLVVDFSKDTNQYSDIIKKPIPIKIVGTQELNKDNKHNSETNINYNNNIDLQNDKGKSEQTKKGRMSFNEKYDINSIHNKEGHSFERYSKSSKSNTPQYKEYRGRNSFNSNTYISNFNISNNASFGQAINFSSNNNFLKNSTQDTLPVSSPQNNNKQQFNNPINKFPSYNFEDKDNKSTLNNNDNNINFNLLEFNIKSDDLLELIKNSSSHNKIINLGSNAGINQTNNIANKNSGDHGLSKKIFYSKNEDYNNYFKNSLHSQPEFTLINSKIAEKINFMSNLASQIKDNEEDNQLINNINSEANYNTPRLSKIIHKEQLSNEKKSNTQLNEIKSNSNIESINPNKANAKNEESIFSLKKNAMSHEEESKDFKIFLNNKPLQSKSKQQKENYTLVKNISKMEEKEDIEIKSEIDMKSLANKEFIDSIQANKNLTASFDKSEKTNLAFNSSPYNNLRTSNDLGYFCNMNNSGINMANQSGYMTGKFLQYNNMNSFSNYNNDINKKIRSSSINSNRNFNIAMNENSNLSLSNISHRTALSGNSNILQVPNNISMNNSNYTGPLGNFNNKNNLGTINNLISNNPNINNASNNYNMINNIGNLSNIANMSNISNINPAYWNQPFTTSQQLQNYINNSLLINNNTMNNMNISEFNVKENNDEGKNKKNLFLTKKHSRTRLKLNSEAKLKSPNQDKSNTCLSNSNEKHKSKIIYLLIIIFKYFKEKIPMFWD